MTPNVWGALLPYRALTRRSALPMSFSLSLSRKRRLPGPQNAQNAGAEGGGFPSGCPRAFSLCLSMKMPSRKRLFSASKNRACDGLFPLPAEEKQLFRATPPSIAPPLPPEGPGGLAGCACDGLSPLPVEEKAIMGLGVRLRWPFPPACQGKGHHGTWRALAMAFSPCLSRKRRPLELDEHEMFMDSAALAMAFSPCLSRKRPSWDLACACDGLFPLPVEQKAVSWTWHALAMGFSPFFPCLSRKRPSHGLGVRLRWDFPPACRGKGRLMDFPPCLSKKRPQ